MYLKKEMSVKYEFTLAVDMLLISGYSSIMDSWTLTRENVIEVIILCSYFMSQYLHLLNVS